MFRSGLRLASLVDYSGCAAIWNTLQDRAPSRWKLGPHTACRSCATAEASSNLKSPVAVVTSHSQPNFQIATFSTTFHPAKTTITLGPPLQLDT